MPTPVPIAELEARLADSLGLPRWYSQVSAAAPAPESASLTPPRDDLTALALLLEELRKEAFQVGEVPRNYPRHVDFVMRSLHAILPWYTRPIRGFSERTVAVLGEATRRIAILQHQQHNILERLATLEASLPARDSKALPH